MSGDFKTVSGLCRAADGVLNRSEVDAVVALWDKMGFGNWQDLDLNRAQPSWEGTGVMLNEHSEEAFD